MLRASAALAGGLLVGVAIAGFSVGDERLWGTYALGDAFLHFGLGVLLLFSALKPRALGGVRLVFDFVAVSGLVVGLVGYVTSDFFGVLPADATWNTAHSTSHVVYGVVTLGIALLAPRETQTRDASAVTG